MSKQSKRHLDIPILITHLIFIIFSFYVAIVFPYYIGLLLIIGHYTHERLHKGCILTTLQQNYGYANKDEDFFHYLFRCLGFDVNPTITTQLHNVVKTVILIIVVADFFQRVVLY
ncbi:hypothetical protein GCM10012290_00320 [Halolactibacillus alkaliphilus]|uniref:Uncharacterized protein n=1 Tax=Halolactibacillus alkaliphilus TaxID=442899 RepID=A0A511WYJ9_9BACI|nr:hypothetical protein [Halolactibacillus alkaliphilus]GEN55643.1 hypothetical protein HAL01_01070 [Halolactibacillus alkaliphilus]GGN63614.1 hypothetical protein GCM10012290_00320 [Halolactibacillus alkaliphilus]SFO62735.1 hypothetical protein SAMN05720591_101200 [Halolactibacillus alkaliphilus]